MANATTPYQVGSKWTIDVDPDDINYVVADVTKDLTDRSTTATSVAGLAVGCTVLEGPTAQGTLMIAKVKMDTSSGATAHSITFRVTCANTEQFDRTIYFNLEDH